MHVNWKCKGSLLNTIAEKKKCSYSATATKSTISDKVFWEEPVLRSNSFFTFGKTMRWSLIWFQKKVSFSFRRSAEKREKSHRKRSRAVTSQTRISRRRGRRPCIAIVHGAAPVPGEHDKWPSFRQCSGALWAAETPLDCMDSTTNCVCSLGRVTVQWRHNCGVKLPKGQAHSKPITSACMGFFPQEPMVRSEVKIQTGRW